VVDHLAQASEGLRPAVIGPVQIRDPAERVGVLRACRQAIAAVSIASAHLLIERVPELGRHTLVRWKWRARPQAEGLVLDEHVGQPGALAQIGAGAPAGPDVAVVPDGVEHPGDVFRRRAAVVGLAVGFGR